MARKPRSSFFKLFLTQNNLPFKEINELENRFKGAAIRVGDFILPRRERGVEKREKKLYTDSFKTKKKIFFKLFIVR